MNANWIWKKQENYRIYNQTVCLKKEIDISDFRQAKIKISADSAYRLFVNGVWVNDGPARAWPEHYSFDELDITAYLRDGKNLIEALARYWGVGTFHKIPQQAGFIAEIEVICATGEKKYFSTDESWQVSEVSACIKNTPKASVQMEAQEFYDARLTDDLQWEPAQILFSAENAPWKNLQPRDVALLTKRPFLPRSLSAVKIVKNKSDLHFCIPVPRLVYSDLIEANFSTSAASGMATVIKLEKSGKIRFHLDGYRLSVDGAENSDGIYELESGEHFVCAFVAKPVSHKKDFSVRIENPPESMKLVNPLDPAWENPWCWISLPEFEFADNDLRWQKWSVDEEGNDRLENYDSTIERFFREVKTKKDFEEKLKNRCKNLTSEQMFVHDFYWQFLYREPVREAWGLLEKPKNLLAENGEMTIVYPAPDGDVELMFDLGEQNIGYYDFELFAQEGTVIDIYGVEYITPEGVVQHTADPAWDAIYRNGMRYVCKQGFNRFTSVKRRSGRYLFFTIRNFSEPVKIRKFQLIESTYPVESKAWFRCSDWRLNKIWEISERTLKLCMEDTFTDCPLYEQTLWVGDARNEAVFGYWTFDAQDIGKRCIRLAAQSLERFPIVGCQVPSAWDCLLPAWGFLWGISVWDYFDYSGDIEFLKSIWNDVIKNIEGAEKFLDEHGLFSAPLWNMFDWSGIDDQHETVLHNSMLLAGAINAAIRCAKVLQDEDRLVWLENLRDRLRRAINQFWDEEKQSFPDSIHENGEASESTSQHTSFLSLLYDIVDEKKREAAIANVLHPKEEMVKVGSPFAMMYFYETLEKLGFSDRIIQSIYESYVPMIDSGATTVWEVFPSSEFHPQGFPTRSHAHAWSSAPLYFLPRIILGIRQVRPGGEEFIVCPDISKLKYAKGAITTGKGVLAVSWHVEKNDLFVRIQKPPGANVRFVSHESHQSLNLKIEFVERIY